MLQCTVFRRSTGTSVERSKPCVKINIRRRIHGACTKVLSNRIPRPVDAFIIGIPRDGCPSAIDRTNETQRILLCFDYLASWMQLDTYKRSMKWPRSVACSSARLVIISTWNANESDIPVTIPVPIQAKCCSLNMDDPRPTTDSLHLCNGDQMYLIVSSILRWIKRSSFRNYRATMCHY